MYKIHGQLIIICVTTATQLNLKYFGSSTQTVTEPELTICVNPTNVREAGVRPLHYVSLLLQSRKAGLTFLWSCVVKAPLAGSSHGSKIFSFLNFFHMWIDFGIVIRIIKR